jgi:DNA-binding beta-propeller fold protein YncE
MRVEWLSATATILAGAACVRAASVIPVEYRIEASVVMTLNGPTDQPMHMPTDVAVDRAGRVYVADGAHDRVVRFKPDGGFDGVIARDGEQTLSRPVGLATDARDRLWIADTGNHRLVVVSPEGTSTETIALPTGTHPCDPTDLLVTPDGRRTYIVDNDNHRLLVRSNRDGVMDSLGGAGEGLGRFQWPFMVCIGRDDDVFVSDVIGARVQRANARHQWTGQIGRWGVELGRLYRPKGVVTDPAGRLLVGDSTLGVIQVFSPNGPIAGVLTRPDGTPLRFDHPMGMTFDARGRLYVVELQAHRVVVITMRATSTVPPKTGEKESER